MKNKCIIITKNKNFFIKIGNYLYEDLKILETLPQKISLDAETTGLFHINDDIFSVQIGTGSKNFLIDCYTTPDAYTVQEILPYLKGKILIFHNACFDLRFLLKYGFVPEERKVLDTMIASQCLYNGKDRMLQSPVTKSNKFFSHSFGDVFELEMGILYDKTEQKNISKIKLSTKESIEYSFQDVDRLLELEENLANKLKSENSYTNYTFQSEFLNAQAYTEFCGLPISVPALEYKIKQDKINLSKAKREVTDFIIANLPRFQQTQLNLFSVAPRIKLNLNSPKQMIEVFEELEINVIDPKTGKKSISEDIINKSDNPFVKIWLNLKSAQHSISNFGQNILDQVVDGRVYTNFRTFGETGRMQSRKGGINFLNFPAEDIMRKCIATGPDTKIVAADFEGQEKVTMADITEDPATLKLLNNNLDPHCAFARVLFPELEDLSDKEIKDKHKDKRQYAKSPSFALAYGSGAFGIASGLNIPIERAIEIEKSYKQLYAGLYSYGEKKLQESLQTGYISLPYGFKYHLPDILIYQDLVERTKEINWEPYRTGKQIHLAIEKAKENKKDYIVKDYLALEYYRKWKGTVGKQWSLKGQYLRYCLNYPSQSCSSFQTKLSLILLLRYIISRGHLGKVLIVNTVYDENVIEVPNELVHEYEIKLKEIMIKSANQFLTSGLVKMNCDAYGGDNWSDAKNAKEFYHKRII